MIKKNLLPVAAVSALLVLGGGITAAQAATANTSISQWYSGTTGPYRQSTGVSQSLAMGGNCFGGVAGSPRPTSAQMQMQRYNGAFAAISEGNKTQACGTTFNWGTRPAGAQYRYQLNGYTQGGAYQSGPFSVSPVVINY